MSDFPRRIRIALFSLLVLMPMLSLTSAAAQEQAFTPEAYTSELAGQDIEVTGPLFAITGATLEHYGTGDGEIVTIESEWISIEVSFFDDADTPTDSIDAYISGVEGADLDYTVVERGENAAVTYAIISIHYEGIDVLYYMQVTEDVTGNVDLFETILTTADTFENDLADAQAEISIDGSPFMENVVDADQIASAALSTNTSATPQSDSEPALTPASPTIELPLDNAGVTLGLGPDFEPFGDPVSDGTIQGYVVVRDDASTLVAVGQTGMTAEETLQGFSGSLDARYSSVEPIDSRISADTAWSLFRVISGGENRVVLVYADTATVPGFELLVSTEMPEDAVADSIDAVQSGLSLDGEPLLAELDAEELATLAEPDAEANETPLVEETAEATQESAGRPRDDAKLPSGDGTSNTSEVNSTPGPTEEPVTQSDSSWQGPVLGHVIEWDVATWFVDLTDSSAVESDQAEQYESITMTAELSPTVTLLYIDMYGDNDSTPADYLAYWSSDEFLRHETSSGDLWTGELVSSRNRDDRVAVVISYSNDGGEFYLIREAITAEDGTVMLLTLDVPAGDLTAAYAAAQDGVSIDGEPAFSVFTPSQIERLVTE